MARATVFVFLPAFRLSRVLGLAAFPWPQKGRAPRYHRALSVLFLTCVLACALHSEVTSGIQAFCVLRHVPGTALLDATIVRIHMVLSNPPVIAVALSTIFHAQVSRQIIVNLGKTDFVLQNSAFKKIKTKVYVTFSMYMSLWLLVLISLFVENHLHPWEYLPYMVAALIMLCAEQNVVILSTILRQRFIYINDEVQDMQMDDFALTLYLEGWTEVGVKGRCSVRCRRLRNAHAALCDVLRDVDTTYRKPLLVILISHFFTIVGGIYLVCVFLVSNGTYDETARMVFKRPDFNRFTTIVCSVFFSALRLVVLTCTCDSVVSEVSTHFVKVKEYEGCFSLIAR